jgi:hypothetical protein
MHPLRQLWHHNYGDDRVDFHAMRQGNLELSNGIVSWSGWVYRFKKS